MAQNINHQFTKPVIFLAFAQDRVEGGAYLRNLPIEQDGIRKALQKARQAGLCEVVERSNTTVENILDVFQEYQDRIAIFHYGGHADSYELLLESLSGEHAMAHSEGLVSFLAKQKGLQLVFLNGCCSQQQALDLIEAGLPAVVGTSQKIDDGVATKLSVRFYQGLAAGLGIDRAWVEAIDQVKIEKGAGNVRGMHGQGLEEASDRFPWEIYYRQGAEQIKEWNLPEAVGNPLFGLPEIPKIYDLPESPFLFLRRYERPHAEIFFGRSYYVRALCNRVNDPHADPLILLYGQSGVGKSSLLEAGLYPRLETDYTVIYARRHVQKGLSHTLGAALQRELAKIPKDQLAPATAPALPQEKEEAQTQATNALETQPGQVVEKIIHELEAAVANSPEAVKQEIEAFIERLRVLQTDAKAQQTLTTPLTEESLQATPDTGILIDEDIFSFLEKWLVIEAHTNKPLLVILDQVEEHFTRPNPNLPDELDDFMLALRIIFSSPALRPKGKMILSYRKEYHAEIEARFRTFLLPRSTVFLETLTRKDILDIFRGVTQTPALQKRYHLTVDEELPVMIADDLLEDKDSPVAPVLQIVLTKLWNAAVNENAEAPHFAAAQYQQIKKDGIAMGEFFEQQMKELRHWQQEIVDSGLALDLLYFHTSRQGAADSSTLEALRRTYEHRQETIKALVDKCKELYLLTESQQGQEATSLTHDTLASEVIKQYNTSDKPGQRASRILGSKIREFNGNNWLDEMDLQIVEQGLPGMRGLSDNEKKLLDLSRRRREELERERRRNRQIRRILVTAIILFAGFAVWQWRESVMQKKRAEFQAAVAQSNLLAKEADEMFQNDRTQALRLAEAAYQLNPTTSAEKALLKIFYQARFEQRQFYTSRMPHGSEVTTAVFSPDGSKILTTCLDDTARLWSKNGELLAKFPHEYEVNAAIFSLEGNEVLTASDDATARLWLVNGDSVRTYQHTNNVNTIRFSREGTQILTACDDDSVRLWSKSGNLIAAFRHQGAVLSAVFSNDENWILSASSDNTARRWPINDGTAITFQHQGPVYMAVNSPDGEFVLTVSDDEAARLWSANGDLQKTFQHDGPVKSALFLANNDEILTASDDGMARIWSTGGDLRKTFEHRGPVFSAVSSQDGSRILTAARDSTAKLWSKEGELLTTLQHDGPVNAVIFSEDESYVLTASRDQTARLWPTAEVDLITLQHEGEVNTAVFSSSGDFLLTASGDYTARLWSAEGVLQATLSHDGEVLTAIFSPDGGSILTASRDKTARLWSLQGHMRANFQHDSTVYAAVFSPDGNQILTASLEGKARLWLIDRGLLTTFAHRGPVYSVAFSPAPAGRQILTASDDSTARLWSLEGKEITAFQHEGEVWAAQFSPDGHRVLTASEDNTARLWSLEGKLLATLPHEGRVWKIVFSPDGNQILTAAWDNFARLWSTDGKLITTYPHEGWLYSARFSSNGRHILTASDDVTARLWSITGDTLMTFQHQGPVYFAVFSNDGRQIITASADTQARLWQTPAGIATWLKTAEVYRLREAEKQKCEIE
ncbi:AAA family ATPase [bacterium]|nr:AAA family ATPase [bacterium]